MTESPQQNVLIVIADRGQTRLIQGVLEDMGLAAAVAGDGKSASKRLESHWWDLVLVDRQTPGLGGYDFVRRVKDRRPDLPVVMISDDASARAAVLAMREGCQDYLVKPLREETLERALAVLVGNRKVSSALAGAETDWRIVGSSPSLLETIRLARRVAPTPVPILITGESGTGKELISHLVHYQSNRRTGPYVHVNCAALSESLLESELFGHERGAFTGACSKRLGRFERAHGGTLLLDEVSETTPRLQAELLRVLEQQDFERLGGSESIRVNVRVICTSNRDLAAQVRKGRFRGDLYYRICGVHLRAAPLRERIEDVTDLVWHFVNLHAREVRRKITSLDERMLQVLRSYSWPGNVRELRNVVRAALILGHGSTLSLHATQMPGGAYMPSEQDEPANLSLREVERRAIFEALRRTRSHHAKAAGLLGITDRTLREKLRKYRESGLYQPAGESRWIVEPA